MVHCCKYTKGKEDTFVFVSNSNQHVCKGKKPLGLFTTIIARIRANLEYNFRKLLLFQH